jgi:hypothetical protein
MHAEFTIGKPHAAGHMYDSGGVCGNFVYGRPKSRGDNQLATPAVARGRVYPGERPPSSWNRSLPLRNHDGFSTVEVLLGFGLVAVFVLATLSFSNIRNLSSTLSRTTITKDRLIASVRTIAGMPAALRNSVRASVGGKLVNPALYACVSGLPANTCANGIDTPFTLFTPTLIIDASGNLKGVQPITSPTGAAQPLRFDTFGSPCSIPSPRCSILVFTSFSAQCPPAPRPSPAPVVTAADELQPMANCTIAESVTITYKIQIDPNQASSMTSLAQVGKPFVGNVTTLVKLISGNTPQ